MIMEILEEGLVVYDHDIYFIFVEMGIQHTNYVVTQVQKIFYFLATHKKHRKLSAKFLMYLNEWLNFITNWSYKKIFLGEQLALNKSLIGLPLIKWKFAWTLFDKQKSWLDFILNNRKFAWTLW